MPMVPPRRMMTLRRRRGGLSLAVRLVGRSSWLGRCVEGGEVCGEPTE